MKKNKIERGWSFTTIVWWLAGIAAAQGIPASVYCFLRHNKTAGFLMLLPVLAAAVVAAYAIFHKTVCMGRFMSAAQKQLNRSDSQFFGNIRMPVLFISSAHKIIWYNSVFKTAVLKGEDVFGEDAEILLPEGIEKRLSVSGHADLTHGGRKYTVWAGSASDEEFDGDIYLFSDDTALKNTAIEFSKTRPVVVMISIDALDETVSHLPESQQAAIRSDIELRIEKWAMSTGGFMRKLNNGRYIMAMDEQGLETVKNDKFNILDAVRELTFEEKHIATLSIGVGHSADTLRDCETMAAQALDMALGRGGDQAVVKTGGDFEFFGGVSSSGSERRTKVRTRIIASALRELIEGSDTVLITGHRFADLDCLGAAYGIFSMCRALDRKAAIVMNRENNLAKQLMERIESESGENIIINPDDAVPLVTKQTLVVVVDTHRAGFLDGQNIFDICNTAVVIDHHRKTTDFIDNAVIFYHEPYASSACEMVSELLQYMGGDIIGKSEAEALLSGIMLDTRNFVMRTGVRTFEASAYLRSRGADPVSVKKLFSESMDIYREKAAIVSCAEIYRRCAISIEANPTAGTRLAAAQAADELLTINDVDASFVIFNQGGTVNISARSLGAVNVQVIMEELGGGGHLTMAAAQLADTDEQTAKELLTSAIDRRLE